MFDIGRICVKLAGKESGRTCVVVDKIDDKTVLIDGDVKRRNCNLLHLEPTNNVIKIKKGASTAEIKKELKSGGMIVTEKKNKEKTTEKPIKRRSAKKPKTKEETVPKKGKK